MADWCYVLCLVSAVFYCLIFTTWGSDVEADKPCTYFGGSRVARPESSLVNCSWYASNACCKRTEVTSVFGGMKSYPLYGATKECRNQINYLMCYFCSPDQFRWYHKKAYVCQEYCDSVFEHCKHAKYEGKELGSEYNDGKAFCKGQKFEVVDGNGNCFKFDPTVFAAAVHISFSHVLIFTTVISQLIFSLLR